MSEVYRVGTLNKLEQFLGWVKIHHPRVNIVDAGINGAILSEQVYTAGKLVNESFLLDLPISDAETLIWRAPQIGTYGEFHAAFMKSSLVPDVRLYLTAPDYQRLDALITLVNKLIFAPKEENTIKMLPLVIEAMPVYGLEGVTQVNHIKFKRGAGIEDDAEQSA